MSALVSLDRFALNPKGPTLTLRIGAGLFVVVISDSQEDSLRFLQCLAKTGKPDQGTASLHTDAATAGLEPIPKRTTPQAICERSGGSVSKQVIAEALTCLNLWDARTKPIQSLATNQQAACELLPLFAAVEPLLIAHQVLDPLDAWTRAGALNGIRNRLAKGHSVILSTNHAELMRQADVIVVLRGGTPKFTGSYAELERTIGLSTFEVETEQAGRLKALLDPFEVELTTTQSGISFRAKEGQEVVAKLLLEGYGAVKSIVTRPPTPEELLSNL